MGDFVNVSKYKKLIGDRLYLSPRGSSSQEALQYTQWMNDLGVTDYIGRTAMTVSVEGENEHLESARKNSNDRNFNIIDLKSDEFIGTVSLEKIEWISRSAELGIFIGNKGFQSKGYGTEAILIILDYAFNYLNLHSVHLSLISANERAHKCYLKCGFRDTGRLRDRIFINGKRYDMLFMDILSSEFSGDYIRNKEINT